MKLNEIIAALKALAHAPRLNLYRLLVQAGADGMTVGALQARTRHAGATLTHHLHALRRAGLITDRREGRNIICCADYVRMNALLAYLTENCCAGAPCVDAAACAPARSSTKRRTPQ